MSRLLILFLLCTQLIIAGYSYDYTITVSSGTVSAPLTNYPMLISGTYALMAVTGSGGKVQHTTTCCGAGLTVPADLIFSSTACTSPTALSGWDWVSYSQTTGAVNVYVRIGTLNSASNTVIHACVGNSAVTTYQTTYTSTYDSTFAADWHLNESSGTQHDSTFNANNSSAISVTIQGTSGPGGGADTFGGSNTGVTIPTSTSLQVGSNYTFCAWVNSTSWPSSYGSIVFGNQDDLFTSSTQRLTLWNDGIFLQQSTQMSLSTWYWACASETSSSAAIYLNGTSVSNVAYALYGLGNANLMLGPLQSSGSLSEPRLSNMARSTAWMTAEYANMSSPSTFYSISGSALNTNQGFPLVY
jgi:hypothetical protein